MKSKQIDFANELVFSASCEVQADFKQYEVYDYEVLGNTLIVKLDTSSINMHIFQDEEEVIQSLRSYKDKAFLRLDYIKQNIYTFNLLSFYQHKIVQEPYQIVIDSSLYPMLQKNKIDIQKAKQYFMKELIFKDKYWFGYGKVDDNKTVCLMGANIEVFVELSTQGYIHIVDFKRRINKYNHPYITLFSGKIILKDYTEQLQQTTQVFKQEFEIFAKDKASLLKLWDLYDRLDLEMNRQDALAMGILKYDSWLLDYKQGKLVFSVEATYCWEKDEFKKNDYTIVQPEFLNNHMSYACIAVDEFHNNDSSLSYQGAQYIGDIVDRSCINTPKFIIQDNRIDIFRKLPAKGYIIPDIQGSEVQRNRRKRAFERMRHDENPLPGLQLLIESGRIIGARGKVMPAITDHLQTYIFGKNSTLRFNERQKEAIRIALNTPDIAIIQGPPGTGKTQVIKAILERINEISDGGSRVLVTSTQHDAVDNAVKGVVYGGVPVNRVGSKRKEDLQRENPIFSWIDEMRRHCEVWLTSSPYQNPNRKILLALEQLCQSGIEDGRTILLDIQKELIHQKYTPSTITAIQQALLDANMGSQEKEVLNPEEEELIVHLQKQKNDIASFLEDNRQAFHELRIYLKMIDYDVPRYWRKLEKIDAQSEELQELFGKVKNDIEQLKKTHLQNANEQESVNEKIWVTTVNTIVEMIKHEMIEKMDSTSKEQLVYNAIWRFKHELSNIYNIQHLISSYSKVNAATCQQAANRNLSPGMKGFSTIYDYVIIDEAARSNPLDLLIPMSMGRKIILVGDHKQLPHMLDLEVTEEVIQKIKKYTRDTITNILKESLFKRLFDLVKNNDSQQTDWSIKRTCMLNEQFRMHSQICELINVFYQEDRLITACKDEDREHKLGLYDNKPLAWLDTLHSEEYPMEQGRISKYRPCEIKIVQKELNKILLANTTYSIGIITFYSKQALLLWEMVEKEFPGDLHRISVGTVDAFQGKEFDIVILSTVRSNSQTDIKQRVGFLNNNNRLCVAFSRAKRLLLTIGDSSTVATDGYEPIVEPLNELHVRCKEGKGYYEVV